MAEKYETRPFEYVNNKDCRFYEASVNGKYLYQEFLLGLKDKKNDLRKLNSIYAYMDKFGALLLPKTKFRYIGDKQHPDLYEFKKNDIRVYVIMRKPNVFVVLGGYKGEQNSGIKRIKKLFNDF